MGVSLVNYKFEAGLSYVDTVFYITFMRIYLNIDIFDYFTIKAKTPNIQLFKYFFFFFILSTLSKGSAGEGGWLGSPDGSSL